ncbi:hypothetical protein K502DRAFT_346924 [Neoconidiobolus thromboides FSU 785]|nr:hypothetical protein K502DRAFT_346924 [Neoconidiobolus thromboides FSU 785]
MEYNNLETGRTHVTQHNMSFKEIVHSFANRLLYSRFYTILYISMFLLSLVTMILSIVEDTCPSTWFIVLEVLINIVMIIEVSIRIIAEGYSYWESKSNIIDLVLVLLCVITLIILASGCSQGARSEEIIETVIIAIRSIVQFIRLLFALRKNKRNLSARENTIDFTSLSSRMANGSSSPGQFDNEYTLQQIATSDGFVLDDDDDEL